MSNLGMSAALIGSGMAFEYTPCFIKAMMSNTSVGGFRPGLGIRSFFIIASFPLLPDTYVLDEKIQKTKTSISKDVGYLRNIIVLVSLSIICFRPFVTENGIFMINFFSASFPSHDLLLLKGSLLYFSVCFSIWFPALAYKWWGIFGLLLLALVIAIPRRF